MMLIYRKNIQQTYVLVEKNGTKGNCTRFLTLIELIRAVSGDEEGYLSHAHRPTSTSTPAETHVYIGRYRCEYRPILIIRANRGGLKAAHRERNGDWSGMPTRLALPGRQTLWASRRPVIADRLS